MHDFSVTVVSVLRRRDLDYASNHFPIGVMTDLSTSHHVVDIGEENRHNFHGEQGGVGQEIGYGHVMFLRIRNLVEPVSRGMLVDNLDPDYPPICHACDDARDQDGIVLWCHNGRGLEAPVAAALGKLDGFNLFDPFWMDPEYEIWYRLLNCGIPLPASTGSDWFVCSNNRVYVDTGRGGQRRPRIRLRPLDRRAEGGPHLHHQRAGPVPARRRRRSRRHAGRAARP